MSKWHPVKNCLFAIGDLQGNFNGLKLICNRILPLRKSDGGKDKLVFLGDYIDRHPSSHLVLDFLIELKNKYKDQVVFIKGNHEDMLLRACNKIPGKIITPQDRNSQFQMWMGNGGFQTLVGYIQRKGLKEGEDAIAEAQRCHWNNLSSFIPDEHFEFMNSCVDYYKQDNFVFVHGGYNPSIPIEKHDPQVLYWDRKLVNYVRDRIGTPQEGEIDWNEVIVCGHSGPTIVVHEKYMMLDSGSPKELLVVELNSLEAYKAFPDNERLVKYNLEKTVRNKKPGLIKRVT